MIVFFDLKISLIAIDNPEIKSIRNNQANISDAYCSFIDGELWVKNLHINEYSNSGHKNQVYL